MASRRKHPSILSQVSMYRKLFLFFLLFSLFQVVSISANEAETLFLPVKITHSGNNAEFTKKVDNYFTTELGSHGFMIIDRMQAESLADYKGAWPPPVSALKTIAQNTGTNDVVIGNLTVLGTQLSLDVKVFDLLAPTKPTYLSSQGQSVDDLKQAVTDLATQLIGYTEKDTTIASIAPEGNQRIDSGAILRRISSKAGNPYNPSTLKEDLKSIYQMGYFDDVQIDVADGNIGKKITFKVIEKPVISSLTYTGYDELKEEELQAVVNIKEKSILNPSKVNTGVEALKALYKSKGYYDTQVTANISYPTPEDAVVRYVIDEGSKIFIKEINFEGNEAFDDGELADEIETGEKWFMSWITSTGLLKPDQIRQDAGRVTAFYHNNGYLEAKVGEPEIVQEKEWFFVTFNIEEGPRFRVGTVDIQGDIISDKDIILDLLSIRSEEYISRQTLRSDVLKITDYYAERGYAFADVKPMMNRSESGERLDIIINIRKSELVYINRISVKGNSRTRDNVIRRDLAIEEGGVFDSRALRRSSQALQRLGFFEVVNVTPEPTLNPSEMDVTVEVQEKSTGNFSIGAGYSSVDNLILMGKISENNFLGRGDKLSLSANVGGSSTLYNLAYTNPRLNDSQLSWGTDLYNTSREYDDYTRDSTGGALRIGYPVWEKWKMYGSYSYTDTDLSDLSDDASYIIQNSVDLHVTSAVKVSFTRDTRNRTFAPSEGSKNLLSLKYAGGALGGDAQFTKLEGSTSWYFASFFSTVFHIKGAAGQIFENEDDKLPVYERFYLGGLNSIRGYEYGKVSPQDPDTEERIGGDKMWYTNLEFIFPLLKEQGIFGAFFYDTGQVYDDDENWAVSDLAQAAGVEVRWLSPMGPLRVVWGYNLDPEDDEDESVWDFSIGGTF